MNLFDAIILGLVQGLTEFIPVSSSGHLILFHELLDASEGGLAFDVSLHIGTLAALMVFFWKDILTLGTALFKKTGSTRLARLLVIASIPAVFAGMLLQGFAETTFRSVGLVAFNLGLVGILMLVAESKAEKHTNETKLRNITKREALGVGMAQALAIIPGVSRSGSTITAGVFLGLDRVSATRFSFLLAIPITFGAIFKIAIVDNGISNAVLAPSLVTAGIVSSFLSGIFAIRFLLRFLSRNSLKAFAYYRIGFAVVILLFLATG